MRNGAGESEPSGAKHVVVEHRRFEQRFGGYATYIEANTTQVAFFNQDGFESGVAGGQRGGESGGAAADHTQIEVHFFVFVHCVSVFV